MASNYPNSEEPFNYKDLSKMIDEILADDEAFFMDEPIDEFRETIRKANETNTTV